MTQAQRPDWLYDQAHIWHSHTPHPHATHPTCTELTPLHAGPGYVLLRGTARDADDWADDTLSTPPEPARPGRYGHGPHAILITASGQLTHSALTVARSLNLPCDPTEHAALAALRAAGHTYP